MRNILCYGDSNTWGYNSCTGTRFELGKRWTGTLAQGLPDDIRVIEEGLCGRTTMYELPLEYGRNGWTYFPVALASAEPFDLLVLMLGTNDRRKGLRISPQESTLGMEKYIQFARAIELWGGKTKPKILIMSPPEIDKKVLDTPDAFYYDETSVADSKALKHWYKELAARYDCAFLDAAAYSRVGEDGVHLNEKGHENLGKVLAKKVMQLL